MLYIIFLLSFYYSIKSHISKSAKDGISIITIPVTISFVASFLTVYFSEIYEISFVIYISIFSACSILSGLIIYFEISISLEANLHKIIKEKSPPASNLVITSFAGISLLFLFAYFLSLDSYYCGGKCRSAIFLFGASQKFTLHFFLLSITVFLNQIVVFRALVHILRSRN